MWFDKESLHAMTIYPMRVNCNIAINLDAYTKEYRDRYHIESFNTGGIIEAMSDRGYMHPYIYKRLTDYFHSIIDANNERGTQIRSPIMDIDPVVALEIYPVNDIGQDLQGDYLYNSSWFDNKDYTITLPLLQICDVTYLPLFSTFYRLCEGDKVSIIIPAPVSKIKAGDGIHDMYDSGMHVKFELQCVANQRHSKHNEYTFEEAFKLAKQMERDYYKDGAI